MIKRDLLFAGLLLMGVTAFAQPTFDEKKDAKQIFFQDFEADWDEWSSTPIDSITVLEYYDHEGNSNGTSFKPWTEPQNWQKGLFRTDSTMILYNGIKPTDDPGEITNNNFPGEDYKTEKDNDPARIEAMDAFGEADKGGEYVLRYTTDTCTLAANTWGTYKGGYTANYRRNLFVRGLPIEDSTSYRLTFYVKATRVPGHNRSESEPRMSAGVFRGYYHAEKPFSMGLEDDANNFKYKAQFEYSKEEFTGDWEKINLMTYYINDSIANNFVFVDGYWWAEHDWTWFSKDSAGSTNPKSVDLNYIVQPDKFFVRLGFVSDYTEFKVDNLSLTKSWIAGCEYDKDKMRVDFGYKTNLGALAKAAYEKNKIDAVEVVNTNNKYVDVWGQKDDNSWERVPINSIEYHGDGYMYLFTPSRVVNGQTVKVQFKSYKQVLVTFRNPTDQPELALKYTGDGKSATGGFPMGTDTAWIKAGKIVPDFYNELATPNPNIFDGVYSMKELPPVMQEPQFEEGSFGLDPSTRTLWFKYSRQVEMDNLGEDSQKLIAYVGDEVWTPSWDAENSRVVLTRPAGKTAPLSGDVEIEMVKIFGIGTAQAENVVVNYHFGAYDRKPALFAKTTDWKSEVTGTSRPYPTSIYIHSGKDPFMKGDGANSRGKCGLYNMNGDGQYNAGFYLSSRVSGTTGNLYSVETLTAGDYTISFRACGWASGSRRLVLKLFAKPDGEILDGDANGFAVLEAVPNKVTLAEVKSWGGNISAAGDWPEGYSDLSYKFTIPADGAYVFEFMNDGSSSTDDYKGVIFSNYSIKAYGGLPAVCTVPLNESVDAAKARIALAKGENDADLAVNGGAIYEALVSKVAFYDYNPEGGFKANGAYPTDPTSWKNAKKDLDDATNALKLRMDTVKAFTDKRAAVAAKLEANASVAEMSTYKLLKAKSDSAIAYPVTTKSGTEIYAFNDRMQKAIDALDARIALNKKLSDELNKGKGLLDDANANKDYEEYTALERTYAQFKDYDLVNTLDEEINATYDLVHAAVYDYEFRYLRKQFATVRMHELDSIAKKLGSDIVDNETVKAGLAAIEEDDPALAAIYISAIKIALYEKLDTDDAIYDEDSLVLTPFISNYNLYQTPNILEKMDLQMPKNSGDMAVIGPKGENMLHTRHQYNENGNMPIWVIVPEQDITDLYPGWTVRAFRTGNTMVTGDKSYNNYKNQVPVFDGEIGMDWNCKAELKQDLANLPVGYYTLGVELPEIKNNGSDKVITLKGNAKSAVMNDKNATVGSLSIDSIAVTDSLSIDLIVMSENGWSRADNFSLAFRPDKSFDYGDAIAAEQANLTQLLTIVNSAKAVAANVEYFTLGGVQVAAPKAGQILIRKTTNANGKVVTDKVLLK